MLLEDLSIITKFINCIKYVKAQFSEIINDNYQVHLLYNYLIKRCQRIIEFDSIRNFVYLGINSNYREIKRILTLLDTIDSTCDILYLKCHELFTNKSNVISSYKCIQNTHKDTMQILEKENRYIKNTVPYVETELNNNIFTKVEKAPLTVPKRKVEFKLKKAHNKLITKKLDFNILPKIKICKLNIKFFK